MKEKKERKKEREMDRVKIENTANSILPKPQYAQFLRFQSDKYVLICFSFSFKFENRKLNLKQKEIYLEIIAENQTSHQQ